MSELKPCPFCGNMPEIETYDFADETNYKVNCTHCFAGTYYEDTEEDAVKAWNRRADDD